MQRVAIVTDSTSCLSPQLAQAYSIEVVPYDLVFGGRVYRDGVDSPHDFYDLLREAKRLPTTAAPPPGLFLQAFERARERAGSALCITLPANLSSAHNSALQAAAMEAEEHPEFEVIVVPAPAVASGQGLVALDAADLASRGGGLADTANLVTSLAPQVRFYAVLDTLEYLAKGGHVPKAAAWLGDLVGLKPILTAYDGKVERLSQMRSKARAIAKMLEMMARENPRKLPIRALVMHADAPGEAQRFADDIKQAFDCDQIFITQFTPVMGAHSGPGVVGVAFRALGATASDERPGRPAHDAAKNQTRAQGGPGQLLRLSRQRGSSRSLTLIAPCARWRRVLPIEHHP